MTDPTVHVRVLTWDWREQPDIEELTRHLHDVGPGQAHIAAAATGSDEYADDAQLDRIASAANALADAACEVSGRRHG
jgi:hypothetical protein